VELSCLNLARRCNGIVKKTVKYNLQKIISKLQNLEFDYFLY
jgi:hypothetical protein